MATKPKAILSTHDGREASPITKASNVLFENGQTAQDILNDRQDTMISPVIENSSSMFKVGQGDNVDYSNNVVNGAYESMVLKGKSMVNCIQEPSSEDVVLPYEFEEGRYVTINDTKESGALGVELKGQTLVNLSGQLTHHEKWVEIGDDLALNLPSGNGQPHINVGLVYKLKKDTIYTVVINMKLYETGYPHICFMDESNRQLASDREWTPSTTGVLKTKFTTSSTVEAAILRIIPRNGIDNIYTINKNIIILEGDYTKVDIPYFTGMQSVKMPILTTTGKNLTSLDICYDTFMKTVTGHNNTTFDNGVLKLAWSGTVRRANLIENVFKPNTQYTLSYWCKAPEGSAWQRSMIRIKYTDGTESRLSSDSTSSTDFARQILVSEPNKTVESVYVDLNNVLYINQIQLEESTTATPYEPYKSSILTVNEDVELRGIGDVQDTLDCLTGEYTKAIYEYTFTGDEGWQISGGGTGGYTYFTFISGQLPIRPNYNVSINIPISCDRLPIITHTDFDNRLKSVGINLSYYFRLNFSDCNSNDGATVEDLKAYLKANPTTVQYPISKSVKTVDLNVVDQNGSVIPTLKSWNTTTHIYSEIPENTLYPTLSHSNPSYPVILKPSTKYSIVANSYSNNHTNSTINFNLGGATATTTVGNRVTTITTPSTLSNELLTMSGRGNKLNNVMVIEGDVVGDEPYFEGICDCKSPILSNVGKNLFDGKFDLTISGTHAWSKNFIKVLPNTTYIFSHQGTESDRQVDRTEYYNEKFELIGYQGIDNSITTPNDCHYIKFRYHLIDQDLSKVENTQLEQGTVATPYEPHKSNILSANGDKIELTEDMFEEGGIGGYASHLGKTYEELKSLSPSSISGKRLRTVGLVKVKPNTSYNINSSDNFAYLVCGFNANKIVNGGTDTGYVKSTIFTTSSDTHYIAIIVKRDNNGSINMLDFKNANFTLSEVDKTIVLRSLPNGVCDTLNVETGEYVQRIGDYTVNGTETSWFTFIDTTGVTNNYLNQTSCAFGVHLTGKAKGNGILCDKLPTRSIGWWGYEHTGEGICGIEYDNRIFLRVKNEKTGVLYTDNVSTALEKAKTYLASNPVTVQYELATPIVSTIDVQGFPYAYENGHVQLSSGSIEQSLTPKVEYSVATNRNGQIRSNQKIVERHQKQLDQLQAIILANLVNSQYNQTLTTLKYELSRV